MKVGPNKIYSVYPNRANTCYDCEIYIFWMKLHCPLFCWKKIGKSLLLLFIAETLWEFIIIIININNNIIAHLNLFCFKLVPKDLLFTKTNQAKICLVGGGAILYHMTLAHLLLAGYN